jgi:hypothetical protein
MQLAPRWVHLAGLPDWGDPHVSELGVDAAVESPGVPEPPSALLAQAPTLRRFLGFLAQHEALQVHTRLQLLAEPAGERDVAEVTALVEADWGHLQLLEAAARTLSGPVEGSVAFEVTARTIFHLEDPVTRSVATEVLAGGIYADLLASVLEQGSTAWLEALLRPMAVREEEQVQAAIKRVNQRLGQGVPADAILTAIEPRASFLFAAAGADDEIKESLATAITGRPGMDAQEVALLLKDVFTRIEKNKFRRLLDAGIPEEAARAFVNAFSLVGPGIC